MEEQNQASGNGKTVAVLSYITLIGWIIALVMHNNEKSELGAFHLRQGIGIILTGIVLGWVPFLNIIIAIALFIFWLLGLISAINGEMKPIPLLGEFFQRTFAGLR